VNGRSLNIPAALEIGGWDSPELGLVRNLFAGIDVGMRWANRKYFWTR
jgi:hypothetical protein